MATMEFEPVDRPRPSSGVGRMAAIIGAGILMTAAAGVGYGIGRSAGDDSGGADRPAITAEESAGAEETSGRDAGSADPARTVAPEEIAEPATTSAPAGEAGADEVTTDFVVDDGDDVAATGASGGQGYSAFGGQPMDLLFERTTETGFTLRAHLGELWDEMPMILDATGEPTGWTPAPWCYESGQIRVAIAGSGVIDVGGVGWYREPFQGRAVSWLSLGGADGASQWIVVTQTSAEVTGVSVTFADGSTDAATPQNGVALLTAPGTPARAVDDGSGFTYWTQDPPEFTVTFVGGPEPVVVDSGGVTTWEDPEFRASCEPPPPALPEPGEQPADPAAAEAEIVEAMRLLYDSTDDIDADDGLLDDVTGVADARAQVAEGSFGTEAASARAVVEELVFTEPGEAWFRYRVDTDGIGLSHRYGVAVLIDGGWRITRSTVCQDLSMAGGDCGAGWSVVQPPSVTGNRSGAD